MFEYERLESLEVYRRDASMVVRPEGIFKEGLEVTKRDASTCIRCNQIFEQSTCG